LLIHGDSPSFDLFAFLGIVWLIVEHQHIIDRMCAIRRRQAGQ
jgi:hypothetical protein